MRVKNDRKKRERTKTVNFVIDAYKTLLEQRRKTSLNPTMSLIFKESIYIRDHLRKISQDN